MVDYKLTATADYIYDSVDKGVTWVKQSGSPKLNWSYIAGSSDGKIIIAYTDDTQKIYISHNSGTTYTNVTVLKNGERCISLDSSSDGKILYIGAESGTDPSYVVSIYRSVDRGVSWVKVYNEIGPHLSSIACSADGHTIIIVGGYSVAGQQFFIVSTDSGITWKNVYINGEYHMLNWNSVACSSDGKFIVASNDDDGFDPSIWTFIVKPDGVMVPTKKGSGAYTDLACSGSGSTIIGISSNGIFISYNYGVDWVNKSSKNGSAVACSIDANCLAFAAYDNFISTSFDGGKTWINQPGSSGKIWKDIMITNTPVCVLGKTKILMADGSWKPIKDIVRGERVITDREKGSNKKVARVLSSIFKGNAIRIPKGTMGSTEDVISTEEHPVWAQDDTYRMKSKHVNGAVAIQLWDMVYNLQFEEEGTYYAEGIRMDSVSPYFYQNRLSKDLYFNKAKHDKRCIIKEENDPRRGKPPMKL